MQIEPLWWGFWSDYPKVKVDGREYAQIGHRLYTEHAVTCFLPSGRRTISGFPIAEKEGGGYAFDSKARSISPTNIEYAITFGKKKFSRRGNDLRIVHTAGDLIVVTTRDLQIVITCRYSHERDD